MISSSESCRNLVAGNFDVIVDEPPAQLKSILTQFLNQFQRYEQELQQALASPFQTATTTIQSADDRLNQNQASNIVTDTTSGGQCISKCNYANEFRLLKEFSKGLKADKSKFEAGEREYNSSKNRYKDIIPFSHTRVLLSSQNQAGESPGDDYINANYIRGSSGSPRAYIACQGPLPSTLNDFWRMVWECQVSVIVMACNEHESGDTKCEVYWPRDLEQSQRYGRLEVTLLKVRQICPDFLIRKFSLRLLMPEPIGDSPTETTKLSNNSQAHKLSDNVTQNRDQNFNNQAQLEHEYLRQAQLMGQQQQPRSSGPEFRVVKERTVCQFHYTTWPDHGVPDSVDPILEMVKLMRDVQPDDQRPILVHCSAGCGRTGTICCIDYVWNMLKRGDLEENFNLCRIVSEMRQQRMSMVQTLEQYILCHKAVATLFTRQLSLMETCGPLNGYHQSMGSKLECDMRGGESKSSKGSGYLDVENNQNPPVENDFGLSNGGRMKQMDEFRMEEEDEDLGPVFI